MFRLNLKIALRNLWRYKGYTAINVVGLSIGLASCLLIFTFLKFQLSFDQNEKQDRIYRVVTSFTYDQGNAFYTSGVPIPLSSAIRNDFPQMEKVAAVRADQGILLVKGENGAADLKLNKEVFYAEPDFFELLGSIWLAGKPTQSLAGPNMVTLSETTAAKYFGTWQNAVGKTIRFENKTDFKVTGVFKDFPKNSSFPFDVVFSYASFPLRDSKNWGWVTNRSECYVLLKQGINIGDLEKPLAQFIKKYYVEDAPGKENHYFQPLGEVRHDARFNNFRYKTISYKELGGLGIIGAFLLLTACINFINLATAQAVSRSKEVGIRKVMGSGRQQLIMQFLSETVLITTIALLLACILTELSLPKMQVLMEMEGTVSLFNAPVNLLFMFVLLLFVSFMAGLYPAMIMSGFSPAMAIKNKINTTSAGGLGLRKTLVVVQFAITGILIISTLFVLKQMDFMRNKSLGFDSKAVVVIPVPSDSLSRMKFDGLSAKIMNQAGVKHLSFFGNAPLSDGNNEMNFSFDHRGESENFQLSMKLADEHYLETFSLPLLAGRGLSKSDTTKELLVNEQLLKMLNITHPQDILGKMINIHGHEAPVVGVLKNFNNLSLKETISPIVISSDKKGYNSIGVKLTGTDVEATMKALEQEWNATFPQEVYSAKFMEDYIQNLYQTEKIMGVLFKVFSGVVIFISFIGLFGLVSFVTTQRTKEIAIRKVLGASTLGLVKMLNRSFLYMVLIANVVAWPMAYIFASQWLNGFAYRVSLNIWPFIMAMLLSVVITLLTVSLRSYKAANTKPVEALKYE